jgi:predicted lipoprotein with Yx(FWY)xxD motif
MNRRRSGLRKALALAGAAAAAVCGVAASGGAAGAATTAAAGSGTVIAAVQGPFGPMLVVGSGKHAGFTLYFISSDHAHHYGCGTKAVSVLGQPLACTGPSGDRAAEWPAITSHGAPVAGPGVNAKLLGTVKRRGVGNQITYAGHPLYLFDRGAGQITGEGWDEPSLPPWHGIWWLMSPSGRPQPWAGMLTTTTIGHKKVLGELMQTGVGWLVFPAYTYSKDTESSSACNGACARAWPPVLTSGTPGVSGGLEASDFGTITRADGTTQVTWNSKPLYFFSDEGLAPTATGFGATGSGNGVKVNGGTFRLVTS